MTTKRETAFEDRAKFTALLRDKRGMDWDKAQSAYRNLRKLARDLSRHNERDCSEEWYSRPWRDGSTETHSERWDRILTGRVAMFADRYKLDLRINGDPRGYALRVMGLGVWNTWGGEEGGYGVPEE